MSCERLESAYFSRAEEFSLLFFVRFGGFQAIALFFPP
jgi:hypothetical protein